MRTWADNVRHQPFTVQFHSERLVGYESPAFDMEALDALIAENEPMTSSGTEEQPARGLVCQHPECSAPAEWKGFCHKHYCQKWRASKPKQQYRCTDCGCDVPHKGRCKACSQEHQRQQARAYKKRMREIMRTRQADEKAEYHRAWVGANRERLKQYRRERYARLKAAGRPMAKGATA